MRHVHVTGVFAVDDSLRAMRVLAEHLRDLQKAVGLSVMHVSSASQQQRPCFSECCWQLPSLYRTEAQIMFCLCAGWLLPVRPLSHVRKEPHAQNVRIFWLGQRPRGWWPDVQIPQKLPEASCQLTALVLALLRFRSQCLGKGRWFLQPLAAP